MPDIEVPLPMPTDGVHHEIGQNELPPSSLHDAENWLLRDGLMRVREGLEAVGDDTNDRPNGFISYIDGAAAATPVLLMATDDTVYRFDQSTQTWDDLSGSLTAIDTDHSIFRVFEVGGGSGAVSKVIMTNGKDSVKSWVYNDAALANLGATVPVAKAMMILNSRLILGNVVGAGGGSYSGDIGPAILSVSDFLDPTTGYNANQIINLADTPGSLVVMQELGLLQGVAYKTDAIYMINSVDATDPFTTEMKRPNISGPCSPRSLVVSQSGLHYYLARDGNVMVFDGVDVHNLGRHIQRYVLDSWDFNEIAKVHAAYDGENDEALFFYAGIGAGNPSRAIRVNLSNGTLWPVSWSDLRITAAVRAFLPGGTTLGDVGASAISTLTLTLGEYDSLGTTFMMAEVGGQAFRESGHEDNGSPIAHFFETGSSDLQMPLRFKSLKYVDHLFATAEATQQINVTIKRSNYGEDMVADSARSVDIGEAGPYYTYHRFPGRRYAVRVSGSGSELIQWRGATAAFALQGRR